MELNSKIFVAGHNGLVGSAIFKKLTDDGYTNIVTRSRKELNLIDQIEVKSFFEKEKPDYVFAAAAKVGGIFANDAYCGDFIYENLMIQNNLIHNSFLTGVKKFCFLGSVCIYPKFAPVPVKEECLLTGELEPTNDAYAIAKIAGIKMCQAYYKQFGFQSICLMPANLYGPRDNFHPDNGHVIPAMLTKFNTKHDSVTLWGDGTPTREFLYSEDLADACVFLMKHTNTGKADLINVGSGFDISIRDLAELIKNVTKYDGKIYWDTTRPNGTPKRPLDFTKIKSYGWEPKHSFFEGIAKTYQWFKENKL